MNIGTLLLLGVAAYLVLQGMGTSTAVAPPISPVAPPAPPAAPAVPVTPTGVPKGTTAQAYQNLVNALNTGVPAFKSNPTGYQTDPYTWLYWLNSSGQQTPGLDFSVMFPAQVNKDGSLTANPNMTLAAWWSSMAPWMQQNLGLGRVLRFPSQAAGVRVRVPVTMSGGWR